MSKARAFAHDIGSIISALDSSSEFCRAFNLFERILGLGLRAIKFVIVQLGIALNDDIINRIKNYLQAHVPGCALFSVIQRAESLGGFMVGPLGGNDTS